jgi:hypothetical protein
MIAYSFHDIPFLAPQGLPPGLCDVVVTAYTGGGDTFDCYADESPLTKTLNHGTGWDGNWVYGENYTGWGANSSGTDTFETYEDQDLTSLNLNDGSGWDGPWIYSVDDGEPDHVPAHGYDTFESYAEGPIGTYHSGSHLYSSFANWDVWEGDYVYPGVNLLGNGYQDCLVGHEEGLYVDMRNAGWLMSKEAFDLPAGDYRLTVRIAGDHRAVFLNSPGIWNDGIVAICEDPESGVGGVANPPTNSVMADTWRAAGTLEAPTDHVYDFTLDEEATGKKISIFQTAKSYPGGATADEVLACQYYGALICRIRLENLDTSEVLVDDNFDDEGEMTGLPYGGLNWNGAWVISGNYLGVQARDDFESYSDLSDPDGGTGWDGAWTCEDNQV